MPHSPGVAVTAKGSSVAGTYTAVSDEAGLYRLPNVPPGEYTITAELSGFAKVAAAGRRDAGRPEPRRRHLDEDWPAVTETVEVTAETPILELEKATQAVNISGEFQRSLPLGSRRDWSDFLVSPLGVTSRTINNAQGGQMFILRGGEIDGHVFQVDGADLGSFRQTLPTYLGRPPSRCRTCR